MEKVLFSKVNYKLIKRSYKSNLSIINNNGIYQSNNKIKVLNK